MTAPVRPLDIYAADAAPPVGLVLTPAEWAIVRTILRRHVPGREVWAFGSRTRGTTKKFADLDLAILGNEPLPLETIASIKEDFSDSNLPYKLDVVDWATTSAQFRKIIWAEHVTLPLSGATSPPENS